jgi:hypothetical protein
LLRDPTHFVEPPASSICASRRLVPENAGGWGGWAAGRLKMAPQGLENIESTLGNGGVHILHCKFV